MDAAQFVELVVIIVAPTAVLAMVLRLPRVILKVQQLVAAPHDGPSDAPSSPPIEALAADLRRLLEQHDSIWRSPDRLMRARRLGALEAAIADCASEAGRAIGVAGPSASDSGAGVGVSTHELRLLLRSLADAGLVLPPDSRLLDRHHR